MVRAGRGVPNRESGGGALQSLHPAGRLFRDVGSVAANVGDMLGPYTPVVQTVLSRWTVIIRAQGFFVSQFGEEIPHDAQVLPSALSTRAMVYLGEDTSGAIAYCLLSSGTLVEEWEAADGDFAFASQREEAFGVDASDRLEFPNKAFSDLGIYIPACHGTEEVFPRLAVFDVSAGTIERAWLLEL